MRKQRCRSVARYPRLYFHYIDSTILRDLKALTIFCGCTARFVYDLVGNPEDRFFHDAALNVTVDNTCMKREYSNFS